MNQQTSLSSDTSDTFSIILELLPESDETDPALVNAVGRVVVDTLQREKYTLHPVYTGQRGGPFIVEVVNAITQAAAYIWANKTSVEEVLNDTSALVTIMGFVVPLMKRILHAHESQVGGEEEALHPIKIAVEIDGAQIAVEAPDIAQADVALMLAHQFAVAHPRVSRQLSAKSKTKVQGRIPPKPRRRRK